jgi:hypothetical protein
MCTTHLNRKGTRMSRRVCCLIAAGVSLLLLTLAFWPRSASFDNLVQARASLEGAGFFCIGDREGDQCVHGFTVAKKPITWSEANEICRIGPMGPEWKGRVWITTQSTVMPMTTTPNDAPPRIWGRVLAFGDPEFLDEIEGRL